MDEQKAPLRRKMWFIILMLIVFFPVGLVLMWLYTNWGKRTKWIITGAFTIMVIISGLNTENEKNVTDIAIENDIEASEESKQPKGPTDEEIAEQEEKERLENEKAEQKAKEQRLAEEKAAEEEKERAEKEQAMKEKAEAEAKAKEKEETAKAEAEKKAAEDPPYELIDGVAVFTDDQKIVFSINTKLEGFSYDMTQLLKEHHAEIENGAVFATADVLTDTYGNEEKRYTMAVYYSQDTIDKINYDNWPMLDSNGLYETADGIILYNAIADNKVTNSKPTDAAPDIYYSIVGSLYEE